MAGQENFAGYKWTYFESMTDGPLRTRAQTFLKSVDWDALLQYAAGKRNGVKCALSNEVGLGYNNMVRILDFLDGIKWVARLRMPTVTEVGDRNPELSQQRMEAEYNTALLVRANTQIPVPDIYAIETTSDNIVKTPFMLMDCVQGNVGMDLGMSLPTKHKAKFIEKMGHIHAELSKIRLPKIGTYLGMNGDGTYKQGPIPGIGGPFDTAAEYYDAWIEKTKFPRPEEKLREMAGEYADEIISGIALFQRSIKKFALDGLLSVKNDGPFPLCHGDFGHNNIIVNDQYDILSVIDWELSFAGPWEEFGDFPLTLSVIPPSIDAPWNYDEQGNPLDEETKEKVADQKRYVVEVKKAEMALNLNQESRLSKALEDRARQQLITAMRLYAGGKVGFYGKQVESFTETLAQQV